MLENASVGLRRPEEKLKRKWIMQQAIGMTKNCLKQKKVNVFEGLSQDLNHNPIQMLWENLCKEVHLFYVTVLQKY